MKKLDEYEVFGVEKPFFSSDKEEQKRVEVRAGVIHTVLKRRGHSEGFRKYTTYVNEIAENQLEYEKFLGEVDALAEETRT